MNPQRKPSARWYVLAGAILVLGVGGSVFFGCRSAADGVKGMDRHVVPGEHDLQLSTGRVKFFYEPRSAVDGVRYSTPETIVGLTCTLTGPDGKVETLTEPGIDTTYNLGGYSGALRHVAHIDQAGTYRLACSYAGEPGPPVVIAVGEGFQVKAIILAIIGASASIFVAVPIFLFTLIRRRSRVPPTYAVR